MKSRKLSPSEKVVTAVSSFVAGRNLNGKPLPSTFELELQSRRLHRSIKEFEDAPRKRSAVRSYFNDQWDTFMAYMMVVWYATLRIALFFLIWGVILLVVI